VTVRDLFNAARGDGHTPVEADNWMDAVTTKSDAVDTHNHDGAYEPSGAVVTHNTATTSVHGIADTANLIVEGDSRLDDARTPTAHDHDGRYYTETEMDALLAAKATAVGLTTIEVVTEANYPASPTAGTLYVVLPDTP
jgi:hypothetical protein